MAENTDGKKAEDDASPRFVLPPQGLLSAQVLRLSGFCWGKISLWLAVEAAYDAPFLLLPFFLGIGIVFYFNLGFEPDWSLLIALCLFSGLSLYAVRRYKGLKLAVCFAFVICIGALCAKTETMRCSAVIKANDGFAELTVRILAIEQQKTGLRILAETVSSGSRPPAPHYTRLRLRALPKGAKLGSGLQGLVFLHSFTGPARPNAYDFAFQNYFRGIGAQGNFVHQPRLVSLPPPGQAKRASLKIAALRAEMAERIKRAIPGERGAVAAALITGERAGISDSLNQALRNAGLAHILAISGLHMALAAGMILLIIRNALGLFPVFSSYYAPEKISAVFALAAAAFYLLLSGAAVAAERSFIMVVVMLCAVLCNRRAVSLRNLAISACIIMLWQPHEILSPSFQMSFAATAALIAACDAWSAYRRKKREVQDAYAELTGISPVYKSESGLYNLIKAGLIKPVLSTCAASIVAGAAGGIYSACHFNNIAPFGLISNILALPLMSALVMPFALLSAALMPLHLEYWPLQIMAAGIAGVKAVAYWVAGFSPRGNLGEIAPSALAFLTSGMALLIFLRSKLRFFALGLIGAGAVIYARTPLPLALIAENGRIAAFFSEDNTLFGNGNQPGDFTMRNWQNTYAAKAIQLPESEAISGNSDRAGFICGESDCRARLRSGEILALVSDIDKAAEACRASDIIVMNFIQSEALPAICRDKILIKSADLALFGTAAIYPGDGLYRGQGREGSRILWAAGKPNRPWNVYRRYGLSARNLPS